MLTIPSEILTLLDEGRYSLRWLLRVDLDDAPTGIWNGSYPLPYEDITYAGIGGNMVFDAIPGSTNLATDRVQVTITHLLPDVTQLIEDEDWHQKPATLLLAILDESGRPQFITPRFSGFLDHVEITDAADDLINVIVTIESNNRELSRINGDTRSDASQRRRSATDRFFDQTASSNADANIYWGRGGVQQPKKKSFWSSLF